MVDISTEDEFNKAVNDACSFIVQMKKCGLNVLLPAREADCQQRFEALVDFMITGNSASSARPDWLTDELVTQAAKTIGARIYSMQQHLHEADWQNRLKLV